jgi:hypothetical protein
MKRKYFLMVTLALALATATANAQEYSVARTKVFEPQNKKVLLLKDAGGERSIILFQTNLRVNTDGSPLSYHPQDPRGQTKALNNICNAIAVRKINAETNLCLNHSSFGQAIHVFEQFRDSNFQTVPAGFRIRWNKVLATTRENG